VSKLKARWVIPWRAIGTLAALVFIASCILFITTPPGHPMLDRTLRCKNNLKQLGTALVQYIDEHGGHKYYPCPIGRPGVPDDYSGKAFLAMLWWTDLFSEPSLLLCPASGDDNNHGYDLGVRDGQYEPTDVGGIGQRGSAPPDVPAPRWKSDKGPNHFISYASKGWKVSFSPGSTQRSALEDVFPSDTVIACDDCTGPPHHRGGFCVAFADTHVEFISDPKLNVTEKNGSVGRDAPLDMVCE